MSGDAVAARESQVRQQIAHLGRVIAALEAGADMLDKRLEFVAQPAIQPPPGNKTTDKQLIEQKPLVAMAGELQQLYQRLDKVNERLMHLFHRIEV